MDDKWTCKKLDGHTVTVDKAELEKILAEAIKHCEMMIEAKEFVKSCSGVEASKLVGFDNAIEEHKDVLRILRGEATTDSIADKKRAYSKMMLDEILNEMILDEILNDKDGE